MVRLCLLNVLDSLGITIKRTNELNNSKELRTLTLNIKRAFYQENKLESNNKYNTIIKCKDFPYEYF